MRKLKNLAAGIFVLCVALAVTPTSATAAEEKLSSAIFAGGCFWCVESDFDHVPGVVRTISGYTGGTRKNPTYKDVTAGGSGHYEAVKITFDPKKVSRYFGAASIPRMMADNSVTGA
jgi:peptide-methionine (S)-S-oxide reductase